MRYLTRHGNRRIDPNREAGDLSLAEQQLVEIARAIGASASILIMDEPTAALSEGETRNLFTVIRRLKEKGAAVVYISHRVEELPEIADRVTVLRDGRTIATHEMASVDRQQLIQLMVGRELSAVFPKKNAAVGRWSYWKKWVWVTACSIDRPNCLAANVSVWRWHAPWR